MRYQGKSRFVNKNTRNTVRIPLLRTFFDDPVVIHVLRDPRATVGSLLKVPWWPDLPIWCENGVTPLEWSASGKDPVELAARLWVAEVQQALNDSQTILPDRYLEVRYENLAADPLNQLRQIVSFCRLAPSARFDEHLHALALDNRNYKFHRDLTRDQIKKVQEITWETAFRCGYTF